MASDARMGEPPARWRRGQEAAEDGRGTESLGLVLPRGTVAELALVGRPEPGKLSSGPKGCPWRGSQGCLGPRQELDSARLGCPYPPAPPCLRDALCHPKDGAELAPLLPPRNGQPKAGWAEPCKEHPGPRWAEAVLAPLALYSHAYHRYPLPFPGLDSQQLGTPGTPGKPRGTAGDREPSTFHHCPFLVEAKHSPYLLSSLLPTPAPADPHFGGGGPEGPGTMAEGHFAGTDWHLGSYVPPWGQPLYLGLPARCKAAPAPFQDCSSSGNKEFYPKNEPGIHPPAKDRAPSQLLGKEQDGAGKGELVVPQLPEAPWRDGRAGGSSGMPAPQPRTPPPSASHPLFLLQPGTAGGCRGAWVGTRPRATDFPLEAGPGQPSEPKAERLAHQSLQPGSLPAPGEAEPSPPLKDGHCPAPLAKPEPSPACLCSLPGCDGCPGVGCGGLGPFEPNLGIPGGHFPCPPSNHTKLKKTWLTRHSEQSLPRCKAPRRDGAQEPGTEGKRSAKRPHGTGDSAAVAKRGTKATQRVAAACQGGGTEGRGEKRMELGEGDLPNGASQEPWCLQSVPCTALPKSIPRCCACAARAVGDHEGEEEEEEENPPESTCRLLHFRRFAFGDSGELSIDGFCTLGGAEGERLDGASPRRGARGSGTPLCLAKYLLGVLGDPFCQAVCRDRDTLPGAAGGPEGVTAWRRGEGAPQFCDACQRGFFNSHWSCARCGFQLCPDCHRSRQEADGHEGPTRPPECTPGRDHHGASLVPTQFVPTSVLTQLWQLLHEVRAKFSIESHCPCREGAAGHSPGGTQELPGATVPSLPPSNGQADTSRPIKEESPEGRSPSPGQPPPPLPPPQGGGTVQPSTLCDLLASTAVKLCLGQDGVRMAFAPVSPALPSDNRLTSILDSIIARVVERKIQEREVGSKLNPPSPPGPPASHCILAPSGLLWLQDPDHTSSYKLFQEHWRRGQPVLVSGLQKRLEGKLWGPESFLPAEGEQALEVVNLRAPKSRLRMGSREFWDGFTASQEQGAGDLLKLESGFGAMEKCRAANLSAILPLPEYCSASGCLNLATYLRGRRSWRWLRPRVCVAYGVQPHDPTIGTKNLTVEATDSISILVHAEGARQDVPLPADGDGLDALLKERLWAAGSQPGALWHIFRAEDASRIQEFLHKASEDQGKEGEAPAEPPSLYLDLSLRRQLREEWGVSGWTLLQFLGDAVLVPAGAPHQVQTLTSTISVEQRFLSPENIAHLRDPGSPLPRAAHQLRAQLDAMIFSAVREAVDVLQGCK
ncbi:lysine-specific demethylase hairless isoform X1 [Melanerpes formicivorus]|uniref:lysine-specific demethylase hairless isoform X1 n=1 Tax=Melanerpes formicivorus TaxID=211600 RepID=UPI00358FC423